MLLKNTFIKQENGIMIKRFLFAALLMCSFLCATAQGETKKIGVIRPLNSGKLDDNDIETIWMTLETEARKASDASGKFKVIDRGSLKSLQEEADFRKEANASNSEEKPGEAILSGVNYLLSSSVGALTGGKYVLNMTLIDCASNENVAGSSQSKMFVSLGELVDELEPMVEKCIKCVCPPPLVAVLNTVVLNPSCSQLYGDMFHKTLSSCLLQSKVRLALMSDIQQKLRENGIDSMQSLPPSHYAKVAKILHVKYLVMSQITTCELQVTDYDRKLQQRQQKLLTGTVAGCIQAVDMNGELKALIPFETVFNFNEMIARGEIDVTGWNVNQYCSQMIYLAIVQNMPELLNAIK